MHSSCPWYSQVIWGDVGDAPLDVLSAVCADILLPLFFAQAKRGGLPKAAELTQLLQAFASNGARPVYWAALHALILGFATLCSHNHMLPAVTWVLGVS